MVMLDTHCPFSRLKPFWEGLGYCQLAVVEVNGHSGGIWVITLQHSLLFFLVFDVHQQVITLTFAGRGY